MYTSDGAPHATAAKPNDLSRSLIALDMDTTLPLKKLKTDENALLTLLNRWRDEAVRSGHKISRIAVAFEAGRDATLVALRRT
jgi:hypothetical protein